MKTKTRNFLLLAGMLVVVGFSASPLYTWVDFETLDLETVTSSVTIDNTLVSFGCSLNRNFMPQIGPPFTGSPVTSRILLSSNISSDIFSKIQFKELWLLNGNETFYQSPNDLLQIEDQHYTVTNTTLTISVRNGPDNDLWNTSTLVDVVIRVRYKFEVYYLQKRNVQINYLH